MPSFYVLRLFHMDYVTRQFVNLAKKLRKDMRESLQKQTDAIRQATKTAQENKQRPLPVPLPVRAELQIPEAEKTQKKKDYRLQIVLTVGTWAAFIAAAVYAGITRREYKEMIAARHQTDVIISATERTANAAEANNRPWLGLDNTNDRGIVPYGHPHQVIPATNQTLIGATVSKEYIEFTLTYALRNFGHSPANADVRTRIVDVGYPKQPVEILNTVKECCDSDFPHAQNRLLPVTVLPGEIDYTKTIRLTITPEMRQRGSVRPSVVGCIWYRAIIGDSEMHRTQFYGNIFQMPQGANSLSKKDKSFLSKSKCRM